MSKEILTMIDAMIAEERLWKEEALSQLEQNSQDEERERLHGLHAECRLARVQVLQELATRIQASALKQIRDEIAMDIDQHYKRRVRIEGKPNDVHGYSTTVYDIETGEVIGNIIGATVYLRVGEENVVDLTYERYPFEGEPIIETVRVDNPVVAVSAFERGEQ